MKKFGLNFLACLCLISIVACSSSGSAYGSKTFENTINWDAEYDVVVAGFGAAGEATAIAAADKGAKVLLLKSSRGQNWWQTLHFVYSGLARRKCSWYYRIYESDAG